MKEIIVSIISLQIGALIGVITMSILQISKDK